MEKFLLLHEYVVTKLSLLTRDVSSWAPRNRQPQGCDTTKLNPAAPNLPRWKTQGHDVQNGSDESIGVVGWGSRDFSCHSQVLFVAEPPELSRLKCTGHHHKGNTDSNALQMEQFLVCRVTSQYNHRFSDRTSIPRTKASPEILQPHILQHKHRSYYKPVQSIITDPNSVNVIQNISLKFRV